MESNKSFVLGLADQYDYILPKTKEAFLTIMLLKFRKDNGTLEDEFTQNDFRETLLEVLGYLGSNIENPQAEKFQKELSNYYLQTSKDSAFKLLTITEFGQDFYQLINERLINQLNKDSFLKKLKDNINLQEEDITDIESLDYWYRFRFKSSSRKIILAHLDELQSIVDEQVNKLRIILMVHKDEIKSLVDRFIAAFTIIAAKADEISETLTFKEELQMSLRELRTHFADNKIDSALFDKIDEDVRIFFDKIDRRIYAINDKIQLSRNRLKAFYQNFQYQNKQRALLDNFMDYILANSSIDKFYRITVDAPLIHSKYLPQEKYKLPSFNSLDLGLSYKEELPDLQAQNLDEENPAQYINLIWQDRIEVWMEKSDQIITEKGHLDFAELFKRIYEEEKNYEVPVQVIYNLLNLINQKNKGQMESGQLVAINDEFALWNQKANINSINS